jgi:uncharacterized protein YutE (UPF0331/DUF86 family)/predicted nucleotidyltransferase
MAFVFGSQVKGSATSESDFDVAVYFKPEGRILEWEATKSYKDEDKIWKDVEKLVGINTDLVILNRAPSTLAFSVLQEGKPIIIKDRSLYLRFLLIVSSAAEDFREFVEDFWKIKQRSKSFRSTDRERLTRVVDFLESELEDQPQFRNLDRKTYDSNPSLRRDVERWVENIVNASIDIAKILLAAEGKRIPQTYRETLERLSLLENFDSAVAEGLAKFSKLRNILAHEYLDIRFEQITNFVEESEAVYGKLVEFVKNLLRKGVEK